MFTLYQLRERELILRTISIFDATRCQILRLKCIKFYFRGGSTTDPAGGVYSTTPAVFKGPTSKGMEWGRAEEEGKG